MLHHLHTYESNNWSLFRYLRAESDKRRIKQIFVFARREIREIIVVQNDEILNISYANKPW